MHLQKDPVSFDTIIQSIYDYPLSLICTTGIPAPGRSSLRDSRGDLKWDESGMGDGPQNKTKKAPSAKQATGQKVQSTVIWFCTNTYRFKFDFTSLFIKSKCTFDFFKKTSSGKECLELITSFTFHYPPANIYSRLLCSELRIPNKHWIWVKRGFVSAWIDRD